MIKKRIGVNNEEAFKKACEDNNIILTDKGTNVNPVSYIDLKGKERILSVHTCKKMKVKKIGE